MSLCFLRCGFGHFFVTTTYQADIGVRTVYDGLVYKLDLQQHLETETNFTDAFTPGILNALDDIGQLFPLEFFCT